jgi:hypothetical protein
MSDEVKPEDLLRAIGAAHRALVETKRALERAREAHNLSPQYVAWQNAQREWKRAKQLFDSMMTETFCQPVIGEVFEEVARQVNDGHVLDMPEM